MSGTGTDTLGPLNQRYKVPRSCYRDMDRNELKRKRYSDQKIQAWMINLPITRSMDLPR